jgi:hypothetical protein
VAAPADSPAVKAAAPEAPAPSTKVTATPEISVPKIDMKAVGKMIGGSLLLFGLGIWLGRYTQQATQEMIKQQISDMQPDINRRACDNSSRQSRTAVGHG